MGDKLDTIGETGLQFFGEMTASISHEIKNVRRYPTKLKMYWR
jgi:hypothetical protein